MLPEKRARTTWPNIIIDKKLDFVVILTIHQHTKHRDFLT